MKKLFLGTLVIILIGVGIFTIQKNSNQNENTGKPIIKIGIGLPLTGDNRESGQIAQKAILMFKEDLQKRELKNDYKFVIEDSDVMQPRNIVLATNKMTSIDKVDAIISYWNSPGVVVSEILKGKDILHFNFGNDPKVLQTDFDFIFYSSPKEQVKSLLGEAQKRGLKRVAILGTHDEWSYMIMDETERQKKDFGIEIVEKQIINIGERNFNLPLEKLRQAKPDLYLLYVESPEFEISRKKMLEMGIKEPVTSSELPDYTAERDLFEGIWYVSLPDGDKGFNKRVQEYSGNDNTYGAAYIYDIASLMVDAYEQADNKEDVANVIKNMKSFSGKVGTVEQLNNFFVVPAELKQIKNGETLLLDD